MPNEILLVLSVFLIYGAVLVWFRLFGVRGLMCMTVLLTIAANIEVLILVNAFGMEQTLGNVLFAATFLVTDIISEVDTKKNANRAVNIGIATSVTFIVFSQWWLLYTPSESDFVFASMQGVFSNTPRMMLAGLAVYAVVQRFDVWAYHKWWQFTQKKYGDKKKFLWLRNNGSTLVSQLLNTVLFNLAAFAGTYDAKTLAQIIGFGYIVFIVTSLADTPVVYLARRIDARRRARGIEGEAA